MLHRVCILFATLLAFELARAWHCERRLKLESHCCAMLPYNEAPSSYCTARYEPLIGQKINPCFFECMANDTQLLSGNRLQLPNVRRTLENVLSPHDVEQAEFIERIMGTYKQCIPVVEHLPEVDLTAAQCSWLPFSYMYCVHVNLYVNCPAKWWQNDTICNNTLEYITNCDEIARLCYQTAKEQEALHSKRSSTWDLAGFHVMRRRQRKLQKTQSRHKLLSLPFV